MTNGTTNSGKKNAAPPPPTALSQPKGNTPVGTDRDAISLLKHDHQEVDRLFTEYESAPSDAAKRTLAIEICSALKVHARIEEDLFYPAAYSQQTAQLLAEAKVEHACAKDLIAQIEASAPGEPMFDARIKVLAEYIRHHVAEEEGEIFPLCKKSGSDLAELGRQLAVLKQQLMRGATVSNPVLAIPA